MRRLVAPLLILLVLAPAAGAAAGPKLAIDRSVIDFGDVAYNTTVRAEFRLQNVGDAPLELKTGRVRVLVGC